tara:strand:+ start:1752 stop:3089 length:1338 start_codon:yes stop_codon:yes gene_type:complete
MENTKSIIIKCKGSGTMPYTELEEFQGSLKKMSKQNAEKLKKEIAELGWTAPVFVWNKLPDGESLEQAKIMDGHGRLFVLKQMADEGWDIPEIPIVEIEAKDEHEAGRILLGINSKFQKISSEGLLEFLIDYDIEIPELENISLPDVQMSVISDELLKRTTGEIDQDTVPEDVPAVTKPGDLWELGPHRLYCGDSLEEESYKILFDGDYPAKMIFTDPPYNVNYGDTILQNIRQKYNNKEKRFIANDNLGSDFYSFLEQMCERILERCEGGIYICMSSSELHNLYNAFTNAGGHWSDYVIWAKNKFTMGASDYQRQYESILYGWRGDKYHLKHNKFWTGARNQGDVWQFDMPRVNKLHPTMKPVALVEKAIMNSTQSNDIVLDMFLGSGSTLIASEKTGRICYGIEIDTHYCDVIIKRWEEFTGKKAINVQQSNISKENETKPGS